MKKMDDFRQYIYDIENKKIIGDFERAYKDCEDVWPSQHDIHSALYRTVVGMIIDKNKPYSILDIGCGYGDFVHFLSKLNFNAKGIDISKSAIIKGHNIFGSDLNIQKGNLLEGLNFENSYFNSVCLLGVLWFLIKDLDFCLNEIKRVLKINGYFFCSLHIPKNPIGKEIIKDYNNLIKILRKYFNIIESIKIFNREEINKGLDLEQCITDMLIIGVNEN